jgi:hypothetical protein
MTSSSLPPFTSLETARFENSHFVMLAYRRDWCRLNLLVARIAGERIDSTDNLNDSEPALYAFELRVDSR